MRCIGKRQWLRSHGGASGRAKKVGRRSAGGAGFVSREVSEPPGESVTALVRAEAEGTATEFEERGFMMLIQAGEAVGKNGFGGGRRDEDGVGEAVCHQ